MCNCCALACRRTKGRNIVELADSRGEKRRSEKSVFLFDLAWQKSDRRNGKIGLSSVALAEFLHNREKKRHGKNQPLYTRFSPERNHHCDSDHFSRISSYKYMNFSMQNNGKSNSVSIYIRNYRHWKFSCISKLHLSTLKHSDIFFLIFGFEIIHKKSTEQKLIRAGLLAWPDTCYVTPRQKN